MFPSSHLLISSIKILMNNEWKGNINEYSEWKRSLMSENPSVTAGDIMKVILPQQNKSK